MSPFRTFVISKTFVILSEAKDLCNLAPPRMHRSFASLRMTVIAFELSLGINLGQQARSDARIPWLWDCLRGVAWYPESSESPVRFPPQC